MSLKDRAKELKVNIPALYIALKNPRTPFIAKIMAGAVVVYALSPIDLIPDFIPILGYLDDIILLPFLIAITIKLIPSDIFAAAKYEAKTILDVNKHKKWLYALPIAFIWLIACYFILRIFI